MKGFLFSFIGVVWFSIGLGLVIAPAWAIEILELLASDEFLQFVLVQIGMVISLMLVIGTEGLVFRAVWIGVGCLGLAQALFLIGAPISRREAFLAWWFKRPFWEYRAWGLVLVSLSTMLAYGVSVL